MFIYILHICEVRDFIYNNEKPIFSATENQTASQTIKPKALIHSPTDI